MSTNPFEAIEFAVNPEPRCACLLLLDTSESMAGMKLVELKSGLADFARQLRGDAMAAKRVEIGVVTFGPVHVAQSFVTADAFVPPEVTASGNTPMGAAIKKAIELVSERKQLYRANGIGYYRPWIFLISDGAPTDAIDDATKMVREGESTKSFMFYAVGVERANMDILAQIAVRTPLKLRGLSFSSLFVWLSHSLSTVAHSQTSDTPTLDDPTAPDGWAMAG